MDRESAKRAKELSIALYASAISNYPSLMQEVTGSRSTGTTNLGAEYLDNVDHRAVAERVLQTNWHGRTVPSAMFLMAESVQALLHLRLHWRARMHLGRYLCSCLTMSLQYHLDKDDRDDPRAPWRLYKTGGKHKDKWLPERTQLEPFPKWTAPYDQHGHRLLRASRPCPPTQEYQPPFPETESTHWLHAVHKLESVGYRINEEVVDLVKTLDKKASTRLVPKTATNHEELIEKEKANQTELTAKRKKLNAVATKKKQTDKWKTAKQEVDRQIAEIKKELSRLQILKDKRATFERHLEMAENLRGETFYQRVSVDYRGRLYLPEFSYQGSDFCRAVIEFAGGYPISQNGFSNLVVHTVNNEGEKDTYFGRKEYGLNNAVDYMHFADDAVASFEDWKDFDKPLCFIRSCMEIRDFSIPLLRYRYPKLDATNLKRYSAKTNVKDARAWFKKFLKRYDDLELGRASHSEGPFYTVTDEYPEVLEDGSTPNWGGKDLDVPPDYYEDHEKHFVSHLPIEIDQSSSWAQHMLLMLNEQGNEELSDRLGLGDGTDYRDIYFEIGQDLDIPVSDLIKRKLVKSVAMGWGYGASDQNCKKALITLRNEKFSRDDWIGQQTDAAINVLAGQILDLLDAEIPVRNRFNDAVKSACNTVRDRALVLQDMWIEAERKHGEQSPQAIEARSRREELNYLQWTTPFGFVVHQRIHEPVSPQPSVRVWTGEYGYPPNYHAQVNVTEPMDIIAWPYNERPRVDNPDLQRPRLKKTMRQSIPPALVHSYDAGLLHGTLALGRFYFHTKDDGEFVVAGNQYHDDEDVPLDYLEPMNAPRYPIITIQDAFACHANDVDELRDDLRGNLMHTYGMFDPLARFFKNLGRTDSEPTQHDVVNLERLGPIFS